jgi:hypothetical protein
MGQANGPRPGLLEALQRVAGACRRARARQAPVEAAFAAGAAAGGGGGGGYEHARRGGASGGGCGSGGGGAEGGLLQHMCVLGLAAVTISEPSAEQRQQRRQLLEAGWQLPSVQEVRRAYKRLAATTHPDKAAPADRAAAEARFKEVHAAYQALMGALS